MHTLHLAEALQDAGHEVCVWTTERDLSQPQGALREYEQGRIRVLEWIHQREYGDVAESWLEPQGLRNFQQALKTWTPDVVHFQHFATWGVGCLAVTAAAGIKAVVTLHDFHLLCDRVTLRRPDGIRCEPDRIKDCEVCLERHPFHSERWAGSASPATCAMGARLEHHRQALAQMSGVFSPSQLLQAALSAACMLPPCGIQLLPAGYPGADRVGERRVKDVLRVAYLGALTEDKGVHILVGAVRELFHQGLEVELQVHGPEGWFPEYTGRLRREGAGARVRFCGSYLPEQVGQRLEHADLVVVPSLWSENRPLVIAEAWRSGLPVAVSDLGGLRELVRDDQGGVRFEPNSVTALAECLRTLALDPSRLQALAQARPAVPSMQAVVDVTLETYRRCLIESNADADSASCSL